MRRVHVLLLVLMVVVGGAALFSRQVTQPKDTPASFSVGAIANFEQVDRYLKLSPETKQILSQNRFAIIPYGKRDDMSLVYQELRQKEVPLFITSDSVLHLFHVFFDTTLQKIEESDFFSALARISGELKASFTEQYFAESNELKKEALRRNVAYFTVGEMLLLYDKTVSVSDFVRDDVSEELALITTHDAWVESPLFSYREDYSQYMPRGHYTRSSAFEAYFKAMMWFGRMSFLVQGGCSDCLVSKEVAERQTLQALLITREFQNRPELYKIWQKVFQITQFFVGFSDQLTVDNYIRVLDFVFPEGYQGDVLDPGKLRLFSTELAKITNSQLFGGGNMCDIELTPGTQVQLLENPESCFESTHGFRLFGQHFTPDSFMMSQLVYPYVTDFSGQNEPFTLISTEGRKVKGFPRGLEVASLLGSSEAGILLQHGGDQAYAGYTDEYNRLKDAVQSFTNEDWQHSVYGGWLFALQSVLQNFDQTYPQFMQSFSWRRKQLNTALASWTALRHDTVLYTSQSVAGLVTSLATEVTKKSKAQGYLEPVPDLYGRLLGLIQKSRVVLHDNEVFFSDVASTIDRLEVIFARLQSISARELAFESLTNDDYVFLQNFGVALKDAVASTRDTSTVLIADVHTEPNTSSVLEEGSGFIELLLVAYKTVDGRTLLGAGPILTYYELKLPLADRLNDSIWKAILSKENTKSFYTIPIFHSSP